MRHIISQKEGHCPHCGTDDYVKERDYERDVDVLVVSKYCKACGTEFDDIYNLVYDYKYDVDNQTDFTINTELYLEWKKQFGGLK